MFFILEENGNCLSYLLMFFRQGADNSGVVSQEKCMEVPRRDIGQPGDCYSESTVKGEAVLKEKNRDGEEKSKFVQGAIFSLQKIQEIKFFEQWWGPSAPDCAVTPPPRPTQEISQGKIFCYPAPNGFVESDCPALSWLLFFGPQESSLR
jgi:hypothetical protein